MTSALPGIPAYSGIYAARGYMVHSFPTRFSDGETEPGGFDALEKALNSEDVEWRRSVAAAVGDYEGLRAVELARRTAGDEDRVVRSLAQRSLQHLRKSQ